MIITPILEEFLFRSFLYPQKKHISAFIFSLTFFLLNYFLIDYFLIKIPLSFIFCFLFQLSSFQINYKWYSKNNRSIVYFSSIIFGLVHITNYQLTQTTIYMSPLFFAPKILSGFSLAFMRIKYGLVYSILLHSAYNAIPVLLTLLL